MVQVVEHLPSKYEALSSKSNNTTKKKKNPFSCLLFAATLDLLYLCMK
jgi:hypothetical protein